MHRRVFHCRALATSLVSVRRRHVPFSRAPCTRLLRRFKTTSSTLTQLHTDNNNHVPPLAIRTALVSSTVALGTPAFPAIGLVNLVLRIVLPEAHLRAAMSGAWGTLFTYAAFTLTPELYTWAPALLPFAIGNGVAAGAVYGALDVTSGGPKSALLQRIYSGTAMGAIVGYVGPRFFYGPAFYGLYGLEGVSETMQAIMGMPFVTFTSVATGAVAGTVMYPLLYYPTNGIRGMHWINFSAPALLLAGVAACWLYTPSQDWSVPPGAYIPPEEVELLDSILRYNNATHQVETYSLSKQSWLGPPALGEQGRVLAHAVRTRQLGSGKWWWDDAGPAFDDLFLAWMYYSFGFNPNNAQGRVVVAKDAQSIQTAEETMLKTDGIVGYILDKNQGRTDEALSELMDRMNNMNQQSMTRSTRSNNRTKIQKLETLATVSIAVELLMMLQSKKDALRLKPDEKKRLCQTLEHDIRQRVPGVKLYVAEEEGSAGGESIESQLRQLSWNGGDFDAARNKWEQIARNDKRKRWRDTAISVVAVGFSLAGMFLIGPNR